MINVSSYIRADPGFSHIRCTRTESLSPTGTVLISQNIYGHGPIPVMIHFVSVLPDYVKKPIHPAVHVFYKKLKSTPM
jgi:hypothetical protein